MEERKFVCKYCSKRFPCGKSLGGHIRTHMMSEANEERKGNAALLKKRKRDLLIESSDQPADADGNCPIYGLRENPKKTMRFVHSNNNAAANNACLQNMEKFCKECGKGFPSLKALCGHMACHSEKEKEKEKEKGSNNIKFENNFEKQKSVMDSQSDTETYSTTTPRRRSKRVMRFKTCSSSSAAAASAFANNGSSSVSEVEQEQEEVARCLMMLSKDNSHTHQRGHRFAWLTDSSDNNSVVLEAAKSKSKSPSFDTKVAAAAAVNNGNYKAKNYSVEKKLHSSDMKLKYAAAAAEIDYDSDNSDSGYFRYGPKKVESDGSSEGLFRREVNAYKMEFEDYDVESRKLLLSRGGRTRNTNTNRVYNKLALEGSGNGRRETIRSFDSSKRRQNYDDSVGQNSFGVSIKKTANGFTDDRIDQKSWKYECFTSDKDNGTDDSAYESDENSTDSDAYPAPKPHSSSSKNLSVKKKSSSKGKKKKKSKSTKKSKEHECPICNKIFRSGQALGGHKRSHFVGGSEENTTLVIRPGAPPPPPPPPAASAVVPNCLIDLNLPAPDDE